jgi:hypothetical protein
MKKPIVPTSSAAPIANIKDLEIFVFFIRTSMIPIADREHWFQHGFGRSSRKEIRSRKVLAMPAATASLPICRTALMIRSGRQVLRFDAAVSVLRRLRDMGAAFLASPLKAAKRHPYAIHGTSIWM